MPKFTIVVSGYARYEDIEAETEDEAVDIAEERFLTSGFTFDINPDWED